MYRISRGQFICNIAASIQTYGSYIPGKRAKIASYVQAPIGAYLGHYDIKYYQEVKAQYWYMYI